MRPLLIGSLLLVACGSPDTCATEPCVSDAGCDAEVPSDCAVACEPSLCSARGACTLGADGAPLCRCDVGWGGEACETAEWLETPTVELPAALAAFAIYPDPADLSVLHPRAQPYAPTHPLWSNGSTKDRALVLPAGTTIDNRDPDRWIFPVGTVFFKTFSYPAGPVETRVMRLLGDGWEFAAYRWDDDGRTATQLDIARATPVTVTEGGDTFDHEIPSLRQCRTCHEANDTDIIGFDELQLAAALGALPAGLFLEPPPSDPTELTGPDPLTTEVLAYLQGNCVHCHNGRPGPANSFDMRFDVALANLVDAPTESGAVEPGFRVVSGDPEASALFRSFSGLNDLTMPPAGVQRRDDPAIERFREWIESL